ERIVSKREPIAQRGSLYPRVTQLLDPGDRVGLGALGDLGRNEVVDGDGTLASTCRDDDCGRAHVYPRGPGGPPPRTCGGGALAPPASTSRMSSRPAAITAAVV